jgi:porphobilinogen synthase
MSSLSIRPRRLRGSAALRSLVRETTLDAGDFIYPLFVRHGNGIKSPIPSLPGQFHFSPDELLREAEAAFQEGVPSVLLFGIPEDKDAEGSEAWSEQGAVQTAIRLLKRELPEMLVITDVCLCEYTDHGHCGVIHNDKILNDPTLPLLTRAAVSHAEAGADIVAPSDMMDGRIGAMRDGLDASGFADIPILSYAAKYASAFYGPFRDAVGSTPSFGDRRSYQMDAGNRREALREVLLDLEEGADMVMVKPALAYLDIIREVRDAVSVPVAAYNVSGEYTMVKLAAAQGLLDEKRTVLEMLTSMKRAGSDIILTYHAREAARWLKEEGG